MLRKIPPTGLIVTLRVLLGAWFLYSGGEKVFVSGLDEFTRAVANYRLVGAPWDAVIAYILPWLEIVAALCLMLGFWRRGALLVIAGLVGIFTMGVGYAWSQGLNIACGCRGSGAAMNYGGKMGEFAAYFAVLALLWRAESREPRSSAKQ